MWVITIFLESDFTMYEFYSKDEVESFMNKIQEPNILTEVIA
ncbi:hypothetical protein [Oceanobacillus jeddahense]|nr:hypothetical protein [Oceanobacillus jeddahense]